MFQAYKKKGIDRRQLVHTVCFAACVLMVISAGLVAGLRLKDKMTLAAGQAERTIDVTLRLADADPTEDITVIINGEPQIPFLQETVTATVANGTLLEVDGRKHEKPFSVIVESVSDEGQLLYYTSEVPVNRSIEQIGRALIPMQ